MTDFTPKRGNKSCTGMCNHSATMEMLMKVKAGELAPAMATHIIASLHKPTTTSQQATPAKIKSTDKMRPGGGVDITSGLPIRSSRCGTR
jgi:hypothetical protein